MAPRYLFLFCDEPNESGGADVYHKVVGVLRRAGHDAVIVQDGPSSRFRDAGPDLPHFYSFALRQAQAAAFGPRGRLKAAARIWRARAMGGPNPPLVLRPDDVIVVPEFWLTEALQAFPDRPKVLISQNQFLYLQAWSRAEARGLDPSSAFAMNLGMADVVMHSFELVGAKPVARFEAAVRLDAFPFRREKRRLITFMPRKRPQEAALLQRALERRGRLGGMALRSIVRVPHPEVARLFGDSLIFVSLLKEESLGLPAAEAMAAGCIVVGYTGLGAEQFFDTETGFPVADGDTARLVETVERVVAAYRADPGPLDAMRERASRRIHAAYSMERFEASVLSAWGAVAARCG